MSELLKRQKISMNHLTAVAQVSDDTLQELIVSAEEMKRLVQSAGGDDRLKHKILATMFFEPSTRTSCSFTAAMLRLGGSVVPVNEVTFIPVPWHCIFSFLISFLYICSNILALKKEKVWKILYVL